jgi:hypothetical protein
LDNAHDNNATNSSNTTLSLRKKARKNTTNMDAGLEELERMAMAASADDAQIANQYPSTDTIERWQRLFGYSHMEAVRLIGDQRGDGRLKILESFEFPSRILTVVQ